MICPGSAPIYVRRCPRSSASSCMPPSEMRGNFRPSARAIAASQRGLAHARRSDEAQNRPLHVRLQTPHRQVIQNAVLHLLQVVVILVENLLRLAGCPPRRRTTSTTAAPPATRCSCASASSPPPSATSARAGSAPSARLSSSPPACRRLRSSPSAPRCPSGPRPSRPSSFWIAFNCSRR